MIIEETIENGIIVKSFKYDESDYSTEKQMSERMLICDVCEFNKNKTCDYSYCGCLIEKLIAMSVSKCPLDKW